MQEAPNTEDIPPNQTIYVNNLNEKINKEELKKSLYALFSRYGPILDVVALKTIKMRGQAFIVFRDISSATNALRQLQGFTFFEKDMNINYGKSKSDAVTKLDGTYVPRKVAQKRKPEKPAPRQQPAKKQEVKRPSSSKSSNALPPSPVLFVENLPDECTELMLSMLFQQFPGYKEVRLVTAKKGIAFIEFENEMQSGVAMNGLQNFKITPENLMKISYARR